MRRRRRRARTCGGPGTVHESRRSPLHGTADCHRCAARRTPRSWSRPGWRGRPSRRWCFGWRDRAGEQQHTPERDDAAGRWDQARCRGSAPNDGAGAAGPPPRRRAAAPNDPAPQMASSGAATGPTPPGARPSSCSATRKCPSRPSAPASAAARKRSEQREPAPETPAASGPRADWPPHREYADAIPAARRTSCRHANPRDRPAPWSADSVEKSFGRPTPPSRVRGIQLSIAAGETVTLLGPTARASRRRSTCCSGCCGPDHGTVSLLGGSPRRPLPTAVGRRDAPCGSLMHDVTPHDCWR